MGDPRKTKNKFRKPAHPWQSSRIESERIVKKDYGLKNKKEIWRVVSELNRLAAQTKKLIREKNKGSKQAEKEERQMLDRLIKYGLINPGDGLEKVLSLESKNLLELRLQSFVRKNKMSLTEKQARQFIVHGHILVNGKKVTIPSYMVSISDEISFSPSSSLANAEHPERLKESKAKEKKKIKENEEQEDLTEEVLAKIEKEIVPEVEV